MPADLVIYLVVIIGLLFWLRNVLGTRHGDEPQHPNPFTQHSEDTTSSDRKDTRKEGFKDDDLSPDISSEESAEPSVANTDTKNIIIAGPDVEDGLSKISGTDKNFDLAHFAAGAQDAFVIIVEAFARGDRETLKPLLHDDVYTAFDQAISEREDRGESQETEIQAIRRVEIVKARQFRDMAYISARFTAQEISVTRDENGEVIGGDPDRLYDMTDLWTFGRNTKFSPSTVARYLLLEP